MTDHGLEVVHVPELRPFIDIVCVHGFGADPDKTWHHPVTGKTWINDTDFVNRIPRQARVLSFSYNGDITANLSAASVAFHAGDLLSCTEQALEKSTGGPLFFIAHGFGGTIVKKAIQLLPAVFSRYPRIKRALSGVVYFGTPHTETNSDALLRAVKESVAVVRSKPRSEHDEDSRKFAAVVSHINREFNKSKPKSLYQLSYWEKKNQVHTFQNGDSIAAPAQIFTRDCTMADISNREFDVDCDYADLPRFANIYDKRFTLFISQFSEMIELTFKDRDIRMVNGPPQLPPPPPPPLPPPLPIILPPPSPSLSEEDDKSQAKEPGKPRLPPPPPRDKADELYRYYIRKTENEEQRIAKDRFLGSLKGWSEKNYGHDLKVAPGTCEWFKDCDGFQAWLSSSTNEVMFYMGEASQGKTYLARAISDNLRTTLPLEIVLTFFCDPAEKKPAIWDYLTWTLLQARPAWFSMIPTSYRSRNSESPRLSFRDAVEIWTGFRESFPPTDIYIIIDGLDHYDEEFLRDFIHCIQQLHSASSMMRPGLFPRPDPTSPTVLKFLFMCRVSDQVSHIWPKYRSVCIPDHVTEKDIETFVDWKWSNLHSRLDEKGLSAAKKHIQAAAGIYWPMAKYAVEDVRFLSQSSGTRAPFFEDQLPVGLEQHYNSVILPIFQSVSNEVTIRTILVLIASQRLGPPLTLEKWGDALACLYSYEDRKHVDLVGDIRRHLGSLASVTKAGDIYYHHKSFPAYLTRFLTPEQRNANMAFICLKYLLRDCFLDPPPRSWDDNQSLKELQEARFPFYSYASDFWFRYVSKLETFEPRLEELLCRFLAPDCPQFKTWQQLRSETKTGSPEQYLQDSTVTVLLYEGAVGFFKHFLPAPGESSPTLTLSSKMKGMVQHALFPEDDAPTLFVPDWPDIIDCHGQTPLMAAASSGQIDLVRHLLKWPFDINARGNKRDSVFFSVLGMKRPFGLVGNLMMASLVDELIRHGADPNMCDRMGFTPLPMACARDNLPVARILLDAGASIDAGDMYGYTPLCSAIDAGNEELLEELLNRRVFVNTWLPMGEPPLTRCIRTNNLAMFEMLLRVADVNLARDGYGPIHCAASDPDHLEFLRLLLTRPDLDVNLMGQHTALKHAVSACNYQAADMLLQAGAYTGLLPKMRTPPLAAAVRKGDVAMVELLLAHNAPVNEYAHGRTEKTALAAAVAQKKAHLVSLLLAHGADPSVEEGYDVPGPLNIACMMENPDKEIIRLLVEARVPPNINHYPPNGNPALLLAIWEKDEELVKLLLQYGADTNLWLEPGPFLESERCRGAPLHIAAENGSLEICKLLIEHEPRLLNTQIKHSFLYESPLHAACIKNQREVVRLFLDKGAKADQLSYYYEESPLIMAAQSQDANPKLVSMVLEAAPEMINVASFMKWTPLMAACEMGNLKVVKLLLEAGANLDAKDERGETCVTYVFIRKGKKSPIKILELLMQHGQDINGIITENGTTVLAEAVLRGAPRHVRWLLGKGADPMRCCMDPGRPGPWSNALQTAFQKGRADMIELLTEPQWGLWDNLRTQDWYGRSAFLMPTHRSGRARGLPLLLDKSEAHRALSGDDVFAELMEQRMITGFSILDCALNGSGVLPAARAGFELSIGSALAPLVACERTRDDHGILLMDMGLLLVLIPEYKKEAQTLLSPTISLRNVRWEADVIDTSVCAYWDCQICEEAIHEICYICTICHDPCCEDCLEKEDWNALHKHEWVDVPLVAEPDLNSSDMQEVLETLVPRLLSSPEAEEPIPPSQKSPEEEAEARLQTGLQLAMLHAFNHLAIRRPIWTPYLPLSPATEAMISPFQDLISEQRWHMDRQNLDFESSPWRRKEELRYLSGNLRQPYVDAELVQMDMIVERIRDIFCISESQEEKAESDDEGERPRIVVRPNVRRGPVTILRP